MQLEWISMVNSHWPSLMTCMLNKLLNLKERENTNMHPTCAQARPLSY